MTILQEAELQSAIVGALAVYARDRNLQAFQPYANQQGAKLRSYCADVLAVMDDTDLIALEVKVLDQHTGMLRAFSEEQHAWAVKFEECGVPLAYAYNSVSQLAYHAFPQPRGWPEQTLSGVNRSVPSRLPGAGPCVDEHGTLLSWLEGSHATLGAEAFGRTHEVLGRVSGLRNGVLVLLYGATRKAMGTWTGQEFQKTVQILSNSGASLSTANRQTLHRLLGAAASVFDLFDAPEDPAVAPTSRPERPRPRM